MSAAERYSLLKQGSPSQVALSHNLQQLTDMLKQRQLTLHELRKKVEGQRNQMKKMSKSINSAIEKQQKQCTKEGHPKMNNLLSSPKLKKMYQELQEVYQKNENIKVKLEAMKDEQPQAFIEEMEKLRAQIQALDRKTQNTHKQKTMLVEELELNKKRLEQLKSNSCLIELEQKEHEYQQILKESKNQEKSITTLTTTFLQFNSYYHHVKDTLQKEIPRQEKPLQIDKKDLKNIVDSLNDLADKRKQLQRSTDLKKREASLAIDQLEKSVKEKHRMIRQLQKDILRSGIQSKKVPLFATEPLHIQTFNNKSNQINPETKPIKKPLINKVYMMQKQEERTIIVGQWNRQGIVSSDRGESWQNKVERAKKIVFMHVSESIIGIRAVYSDNNRNIIQGRTMLPQSVHAYSETEILLDDVIAIEYYPQLSPIYLKFIQKDGTHKQIGCSQNGKDNERISLQRYVIKWVEVQIGHSLIGLRLNLDERAMLNKAEEQTPEKSQLTNRSFSNSNLSRRKVILRGSSLGRLGERTLIDHRLSLGKKKGS